MKKVLMTLIVALGFCGSIFAQYESHWPDFYDPAFALQNGLVAAIMVDGQIVDYDYENWDALEIAPFVGDECRGNIDNFLYDGIEEFGDTYLMLNGMPIFYNNSNEVVTFKMYDHANGVLYEDCEIMYLGSPLVIITGDLLDHFEGWDDPDNPIFLCFTSPASTCIEKDIEAYTEAKDHYYLISSPIGSVSPMDVENMIKTDDEGNPAGYDLYYFDQTKELEWIHYVDAENGGYDLQPGVGYLYANDENVTLSFCGQPYTGDGDVTLLRDEEATTYFKGWNLIGNPFATPATIPAEYSFYVMGEAGELVVGESEFVEAMEGIFVIAEQDGEVLTFVPQERGSAIEKLSINLGKGRSLVDRAIVRFDESRMLPKFQLNTGSTKLYFPVDNSEYAVVRSEGMGELPLNFKANENGAYTMSFNNSNVEFSYLHLIDNMTGDDVNLLETPGYTFEAKKTDFASRFRLVFATGSSANNDNFGFVNTSGNLCIYGIDGEATLQVVDVTGRILSSETFSGSYEKHINAAPGVYMLRLINGNDMKVQKIVLN